jgi:hypothetical protein
MAVGLGVVIWPGVLHHSNAWALKYGVTSSLLAAVGALAVLGIRYPLKMLPLLLFELTWKVIWLAAIAVPLWQANAVTPETLESIIECGAGLVIIPLVMPWPYVLAEFAKRPGDRWR